MLNFPRLANLLGRAPSPAPAAHAKIGLNSADGGSTTDALMLAARVEAVLSHDAELSRSLIHVETAGRIVTLRGFVDSPMDMLRALDLVGGIDGVETVANRLQLAWW